MSKYLERGDYHFKLFATDGDTYRQHALDVIDHVVGFTNRKPPFADLTVLDIGCGEGLFIYELGSRGFRCTGYDTDQEAVRLGRKRGLNIFFGKAHEAIVTPNRGFDVVICLDVLEHVAEKDFLPTVEHLKLDAPLLFIAVPDRPDPHGERIIDMPRLVQLFQDDERELVYSATRHARHFAIFRNR